MTAYTEVKRNTTGILLTLSILSIISCFETETVGPLPGDTKPPVVEITSLAGDTLYDSEITLSADVSDDSAIDTVSFYVDGLCVGGDGEAPFEQVWYAGYWDPDETYEIVIEAVDEFGNTGTSPPREIVLAGGARYQPVILEPEDMAIFRIVSETTEIMISWEPVPGAGSYCFRCRFEGFLENDYIFLIFTEPSLLFRVVGFLYPDETLRVYWSVQAQWDTEHKSLWSSERWFQLTPDIGSGKRNITPHARISFSPISHITPASEER